MARSKLPWTLDLASPYLTEWTYRAEVVSVVDPATLEVRIDLGFRIAHHANVRLIGVIPPVLESHRKLSHEYTFNWVKNQRGEILIRTVKGETATVPWFAEVWARDQSLCLNEDLLTEGFGTPWQTP
jgi:hypothetical protein